MHLDDGTALGYDALVVATGARLLPEETEGLTGAGWLKSVFTFYTPEGAVALHRALERFTVGRLVVNVVDMPITCPVAPERKMGETDIRPIPEFIEMIAGIYGCQASCYLFGLTKDDLIEQVKDIITVGEFYALAAGGQIIFTCPGRVARTGAWAVSQPPSLDLNTPGGILGYHRRNVRTTPCAARLSATAARRSPGLAAASMWSRPSPGSRPRTAAPVRQSQPRRRAGREHVTLRG